MLLNCGTGEHSWESLGLQGNQTSQSYRKSTLNVHWKDWCWSWNSNTLAMWRTYLLGKTLMLGKIEGRRRIGVTDDVMVGWHHRLDGHEFEQTLGDSEGKGSLACHSPWGHKDSNMTEWSNNNNKLRITHASLRTTVSWLTSITIIGRQLLITFWLFAFISSWLSLPQNSHLGSPASVSLEVRFIRLQMNYFLICRFIHYVLVDALHLVQRKSNSCELAVFLWKGKLGECGSCHFWASWPSYPSDPHFTVILLVSGSLGIIRECWGEDQLPWTLIQGFPGGSDSKESVSNVGGLSSITGLGRSPGEGNDNPLQYSFLENPMDRGAWLQSMESQKVRHDWATNTFCPNTGCHFWQVG